MLSAGMTPQDKSLSAVVVSVADIIWSAVELSDFLAEDYPEVDFIQNHMNNMGNAVMEYLDAYVYTTIHGASGCMTHNVTNLTYEDLVDSITQAKEADIYTTPTLNL